MTKTIAIVAALAVTSSAFAQGYPVPGRDRDVAPQGYNRSGGYFVPNSRGSRFAIPKRNGEVCPHGFNPSGGSCLSTR